MSKIGDCIDCGKTNTVVHSKYNECGSCYYGASPSNDEKILEVLMKIYDLMLSNTCRRRTF